MKLIPSLVVATLGSALLTIPAFAQGKGGGGGGGRGGGGSPGHGAAFGDPPGLSRSAEPGRQMEERRAERVEKGATRGAREDVKPAAARSAKPAAQEFASTLHAINQSAFAQRRELHQTLDMRLKSSREALKEIQKEAKELRGAAREEFKSSLDAVKTREGELNDALKITRRSTEATWERDRTALGHAYRNFEDAVAKLDTLRPRALPAPPGLP